MSALELKNVSFQYTGSDTEVLTSVNFSADYGRVTLLSGYSGQGKITVLSILCGIIPNVIPGTLTGEVLVDGTSMEGKKTGAFCRKVGVVLQNAEEQIIQTNVEDEIAFGCENLNMEPEEIRRRVTDTCERMELFPSWKTRTLSGGQKQRLMVAAVLAMGQKILLLDEPLANLDQSGAELLMRSLQDLAKEGYCIVVVEHRLDVVLPYVDDVWCVEESRVERVTDPDAYLARHSRIIPDLCPAYAGGPTLFTLEQVAFTVRKRPILTDVTAKISKGERVVLLGENGCGKTTLLRLIARLNKLSGGQISQELDPKFGQKGRTSKEWFRKVGVVYQNPNYQLFMPTVEQEVLFGAVDPDYGHSVLRKFRLEDIAGRHPQSLSEGQKRRLSIAAVVAAKPDVLLLDEPTVGQDYAGVTELVDLLNEQHEETGNTLITVTHDKRCAEALCDHAILLKDGVVAEEGGKDLTRRYFSRAADL